MSVPRFCVLILMASLMICEVSWAGDGKYNYINAADLEARLNTSQPTNLVDIQVEDEFTKHHIKGATPTYAYPVKSDADRSKLDTIVEQLKTNAAPVVVVCPRGAGGATRAYDYLLQQGISADRLLILENGQGGWTCAPLTEGQ
jgi:rhodanese-related sulfurtransferase